MNERQTTIADVYERLADVTPEECERRAMLMAASEELAEALRTLILINGLTAVKHASQLPALQEAIDIANAALAKVTGKDANQ